MNLYLLIGLIISYFNIKELEKDEKSYFNIAPSYYILLFIIIVTVLWLPLIIFSIIERLVKHV